MKTEPPKFIILLKIKLGELSQYSNFNFEQRVPVILSEHPYSKFWANYSSQIVPGGTGFCVNHPGVISQSVSWQKYKHIFSQLKWWFSDTVFDTISTHNVSALNNFSLSESLGIKNSPL